MTGEERKFPFFSYQTAGFVSKTFNFCGYSDEEVYQILYRHVSKNQKKVSDDISTKKSGVTI